MWSKCWGKWRSTIRENGKKRHLGYFANEIDAANAYDVAAVRLFGEFSVTNRAAFPEAFAGEATTWTCGICGEKRPDCVKPVLDEECGDACPEHYKAGEVGRG